MEVGQNEVESMLVDSVVQSRKLSVYSLLPQNRDHWEVVQELHVLMTEIKVGCSRDTDFQCRAMDCSG